MGTAKIWLKRGYDFFEIFGDNGKNNVFVACQFGHIEMLEFLRYEVGMDLYCMKNGFETELESTLEYCLRRANFDCYCYLIDYYLEHDRFIPNESLVQNVIRQMIRASKTFVQNK